MSTANTRTLSVPEAISSSIRSSEMVRRLDLTLRDPARDSRARPAARRGTYEPPATHRALRIAATCALAVTAVLQAYALATLF